MSITRFRRPLRRRARPGAQVHIPPDDCPPPGGAGQAATAERHPVGESVSAVAITPSALSSTAASPQPEEAQASRVGVVIIIVLRVIAILLGIAASVVTARSAPVDGVRSPEPALRVTKMEPAHYAGTAGGDEAVACGNWRLSTLDVERFFQLSDRYEESPYSLFYQAPCSISGALQAQGRTWRFRLDGGATATWTGGGETRHWGCSARECEPLVLLASDGMDPAPSKPEPSLVTFDLQARPRGGIGLRGMASVLCVAPSPASPNPCGRRARPGPGEGRLRSDRCARAGLPSRRRTRTTPGRVPWRGTQS